MFLSKVRETIKEYNMLKSGDKVVVGFSGGPDSLCLLYSLYKLKNELKIEIYAAHINHMIRGDEALRDENFSREFCKSLNIPFYFKHCDVVSLSKDLKMTVEEAGRNVRYSFFNEVLSEVNGNKIALAHNMNDQAETVLMNFLRGSGIYGLSGIKPVRDEKYIRPLLKISRYEIEKFIEDNGLNPVIDSTNLEEIYKRNKVRLELIPYIKENFNFNIVETLNRTSELMRSYEDYFKGEANRIKGELKSREGFDLFSFNKLNVVLKREVLRGIIEDLKGDLNGIEAVHIDDCINIAKKGETGRRINLPKGITFRIGYDLFYIEAESILEYEGYSYDLKVPSTTYVREGDLTVSLNLIKESASLRGSDLVKYFDYDKMKDVLCIRTRHEGDYIFLKGLDGRKKIKEFFIDKKVKREERDRVPLIALGSEIIWIVGFRDSIKFRAGSETKNILEIKIKRGAKDDK